MKNNLKQFRKEAGLGMEDFSVSIGVSRQMVFRYENGSCTPNLVNAYKVAKVLDKSVYDIWPDTTEIVEETVTVRRIVADKEE